MVTFVLIRHGLTDYNAEHRIQGQLDTALTQEGHDQAKLAADYVASRYTIDAIYASDLSRTMDTAKPLAEKTGLPIHPTKELRELHLGLWQGMLYPEAEARFPETAVMRKKNPALVRYDEGESYGDLTQRATKEMARIAAENEGKTVAVVSHGGTIRALLCDWYGKTVAEVYDIPPVPNTAINVVTYDQGKVEFLLENYTDHLERVTTTAVE